MKLSTAIKILLGFSALIISTTATADETCSSPYSDRFPTYSAQPCSTARTERWTFRFSHKGFRRRLLFGWQLL